MHRENIYHLISIERQRQDEKHSWARYNNLRKLAVLIEELGEIARDIQRERDATEELIHLAAAVVRWLEGCPEVEAAAGELSDIPASIPMPVPAAATSAPCLECARLRGALRDLEADDGRRPPAQRLRPGVWWVSILVRGAPEEHGNGSTESERAFDAPEEADG